MRTKITMLLVLLMVFNLIVAGCAKTDEKNDVLPADGSAGTEPAGTSAVSAKDTMVYGSTWADATSLDPAVDYTTKSRYMLSQLYDPLIFYNDETGITPAIAENYSVSEDGLTYTFNIRKGALFHDGEQIKASDIVFNIERAKKASFISRFVTHVDTVSAKDDLTADIKLKAPFAPFIKVISGLLIVSEKAVNQYGNRYGLDAAVGSGPYKLKEWKTGEYTLLESFDDYYLGAAPIKYIKIVGIADKAAMLMALETGQVDLTNSISAADVSLIESKPDLVLYRKSTSHMFWFLLNNTKFPFNDKLLRQAVNYAVNKDNVLLAEKNGYGTVADSNYLLTPNSTGYTSTDATMNYPYDPEKAKELLKEAGYPDGFEFTINALNGWGDNAAVAFQSDLKKVGINAKVELIEDTVSFDNIAALTYQTDVMGTADQFLDADMLYGRYGTGAGNNQTGYSNLEVDRLLLEAREESDEKKRTEMYEKAVAMMKDDAPIVPVYFEDYLAVSNKSLKGYRLESNVHVNRWYGLYFE